MKKLTVFLLVLFLLAFPLLNCQAEDEETIEFTSVVTHALDMTAREWCETGYSRALFALTMLFDLTIELGNSPDVDVFSAPSAVGRIGNTVSVIMQGEGIWILMIYSPTDGTCNYTHGSTSVTYSADLISATMEAAGAGDVYILKRSDLIDAASDLTSALSDSGLLD